MTGHRLTSQESQCRALVVPRYCDFGHCSPSCWKRCDSWMARAWRIWLEARHRPQRELFEDAA